VETLKAGIHWACKNPPVWSGRGGIDGRGSHLTYTYHTNREPDVGTGGGGRESRVMKVSGREEVFVCPGSVCSTKEGGASR